MAETLVTLEGQEEECEEELEVSLLSFPGLLSSHLPCSCPLLTFFGGTDLLPPLVCSLTPPVCSLPRLMCSFQGSINSYFPSSSSYFALSSAP